MSRFGRRFLPARRPDPRRVSVASFRLRRWPTAVPARRSAPADLDRFELRRRRHLPMAGPVQRARRREHQLHRVQLRDRHERLLPTTRSTSAPPTSPTHRPVGLHARTRFPIRSSTCPTVAGGLAFEYNLTGQNGQQVTNLVLDRVDPGRHLHGRDQQLEQRRDRRAQPRASGCRTSRSPPTTAVTRPVRTTCWVTTSSTPTPRR